VRVKKDKVLGKGRIRIKRIGVASAKERLVGKVVQSQLSIYTPPRTAAQDLHKSGLM
jgi:hypothetical protein